MTGKRASSSPGRGSNAALRLAPDVACCLVLALLPLLFFWRMVLASPDQRLTIREGDFTQEYFPLALVAAASLRDGEWPLWNPLTGAGQPLLADPQTALLYPPTWLVLGHLRAADGPSLEAFQTLIPLHFALAALGAYALGRYLFRSRAAAMVTALSFAYCGFLLSYPTQQFPILRTAAWLPWQVLAVALTLDRRSLRWSVAAGVTIALGILAGHPQTSLFHLSALALFAACWCLASLWRRNPAFETLAGLGRFALALGIGFLLAAPQILPTLEFTRLSTRAEVSFAFLANGFSPREVLMGALAPRILSGPPTYVGGLPAYVGVLPLLLAVCGVLLGRGRVALFSLAVTAFGLLLSLGAHSMLFGLLYLVAPGFSLFRGQERGIEMYAFGLALLAGAGSAALTRTIAPLDRRRLRLVLSLGVVVVVVAGATVLALSWLSLAQSDAEAQERLKGAMDASSWLVLMLIAALLTIWLGLVHRVGRALWPAAAVALIVVDLFSIAPDANLDDRRSADVYRRSNIVNQLSVLVTPFRIVDQDVLNGHHGLAYGLAAIEPGFILKVKRYESVRESAAPQRLFDLFDGRYLVTRDTHDELETLIKEPYGEATNAVYYLPDGPGRAWLVREAMVAANAEESLAMTLAEGFKPADTVVLEGEPPSDTLGTRNGGTVQHAVVRWSSVDLRASTDQGAYLVVSQAFYPGWEATLSGQPVPLFVANHALVALWVPPGEHTVALRFRPRSLTQGLYLAALGALVGAALCLLPFVTRRRGQRPGESQFRATDRARAGDDAADGAASHLAGAQDGRGRLRRAQFLPPDSA